LLAELRKVAPDYRSWEQAEELAALADIVVTAGTGASEADLGARERIARLLAAREETDPVEVARLREGLRAYQRELAVLGLTDRQVRERATPAAVGVLVAWSAVKAVVSLPIAAVGVVVHAVPYELVKVAARMPANDSMRATVKLLGNFALFTIDYAVLAALAGRRAGPAVGVAAFVAAPVSGYVTLRVAERLASTGGVVAGYRAVRGRRHLVAGVLERRRVLAAEAGARLAAVAL